MARVSQHRGYIRVCDGKKGVPNPRTESIVSTKPIPGMTSKLIRPGLFGYGYKDRDKTLMGEGILMKFRIFEGDYSKKFLESIRPN